MEWHIWNFPDNIRVYFTDEFRELLFTELKRICGTTTEIANQLKTNKETIRNCLKRGYRKNRKNGLSRSYISVELIKEIIEEFGNRFGKDFLLRLEENIVAYRSWNGWSVTNPILPVKETPQFYSVVFHIIGDGNASLRHSPFYSNTCKDLTERFKKNLQIFGKVETKENLREDDLVKVYFPKAVTDIASHILEIKFTHKVIPKRIFDSSIECRISAVRAFVDDEGCVSNTLSITQKSEHILKQIKELLNSLGIRTGKICENSGIHRLYIFSEGHERYLKTIDFDHRKKHYLLEKMINERKIRKDTIKTSQIKYKVLKLLEEVFPLTKHDVANILGISSDCALGALLNLKEHREITGRFVRNNKPYLWYLKVGLE